MKNVVFTSGLKKAGLVALMALLLGTATEAQVAEKVTLKESAIKNIVAGISHENDGVRRDEIYYAGKYRISEAVNALIDQLKVEKLPSNRLLITVALYLIGDEKGMEAIYQSALNDNDERVRKMCGAYFNEYVETKQLVTVLKEGM